jgi:modulator of FtsH protease HflK
MKTIGLTLVIGLIVAAALVAATGFRMVAPGETAVVRRFGRLVEPSWGAGLHWCFPPGIDRLDRVSSDAVRQLTIGSTSESGFNADAEPSSGEAMTGDLNLLRIQVTVQYRVARPVDFVLHSEDTEPLLLRSAEASVSRALAVRGVDAVLRSERQAIALDIEQNLQAVSDRYQLGVAILGASLTDARPPSEVEAEFAAAQSAESERDRRINEANSYIETTTALAQSKAKATLELAHGSAERRVLTTRAQAQRFNLLLGEAERSRTLTMRRLYIETLQGLLAGVKNKLILPPGDAIDLTVLGVRDAPVRRDAAAMPPARTPERTRQVKD